MAEVQILNVALNGRTIGALTHIGGDRTIFAFAEDYIDDPARPTLGLFFKDEFGQLRTDFRPYQTQVMPFFSNLLPEGPLRSYLARKAGVIPKKRALDVARQTVALFRQHWAAEKAHLPMTAAVRTAIEAHLDTVPIYRELG